MGIAIWHDAFVRPYQIQIFAEAQLQLRFTAKPH